MNFSSKIESRNVYYASQSTTAGLRLKTIHIHTHNWCLRTTTLTLYSKEKKMQHFSFHDPQWSFIYFKNSKAILEFDSSSSVDKCVKYSKKKVFLEKSRIRSSKYQKNGTKLTFDSLTLSLIFRQKLKT